MQFVDIDEDLITSLVELMEITREIDLYCEHSEPVEKESVPAIQCEEQIMNNSLSRSMRKSARWSMMLMKNVERNGYEQSEDDVVGEL